MESKKIKVTDLDVIVEDIKGKPYYEIKYKEVWSDSYTIGFGSYSFEYVMSYKNKCFEIIDEKDITILQLLKYIDNERKAKDMFGNGGRPRISSSLINQGLNLLDMGYSYKQVESMMGISTSTLARRKRERNINLDKIK